MFVGIKDWRIPGLQYGRVLKIRDYLRGFMDLRAREFLTPKSSGFLVLSTGRFLALKGQRFLGLKDKRVFKIEDKRFDNKLFLGLENEGICGVDDRRFLTLKIQGGSRSQKWEVNQIYGQGS